MPENCQEIHMGRFPLDKKKEVLRLKRKTRRDKKKKTLKKVIKNALRRISLISPAIYVTIL